MWNTKEAQFVLKGGKVVHPPVRTDGLELYYDIKGKKNTDTYKNKLLDMSGNDRHGELQNFNYKNLSGYQEDSQLVFDGIDDTLKIPKLSGINPSNFTYQLNNNILAFTGDEVKIVKNGNIEVGGRNLLKGTSDNFKEINPRTSFTSLPENSITPISEYGLKVGDTITFRIYIQAHNSVPANARITYHIVGGGYGDAVGNRIQAGEEGYSTVTYTIPSNVDRLEFGLDAPVPAGDTSILMHYKEAKLEKGSIATDWIPASEDLLETTDLKGNILGDMEDIVDDHTRDEQSGVEVFTDKADDSLVRVEIDGKSYQHAGSGKNLSHKNTFTGTVFRSSETTNAVDKVIEYNIPISPNSTYTLSGIRPSNLGLVIFATTTKVNESITGHNTMYNHVISGGIGIQITNRKVPVGYNYVTITTGGSFQKTYHDIGTSLTWSNIQLEEGSTATEYELPAPTPDYPIEIHSLNDFDVVSSVGERNYVQNNNNTPITMRIPDIRWVYDVYDIDLSPRYPRVGDKYYISADIENDSGINGNGLYLRDFTNGYNGGNNNHSPQEKIGHINTINNSNVDKLKIVFRAQGSAGSMATAKNIYATNLTEHFGEGNEPSLDWCQKNLRYTPNLQDITEDTNHSLIDKINLSLSEPLRSVGDVHDRLFRDSDGLWKVERNVGEQIFMSSSSFVVRQDTATHTVFRGIFLTNVSGDWTSYSTKYKSSHFIIGSASEIYSGESSGMAIDGRTTLLIYISIEKGSILTTDDITGFNSWLSSNPVTILYQYATPTIETLDQELQDKLNNLRSFKHSNYVYTIINEADNLPGHISENLKPQIHTEFLAKDHYKENRTVNNLLIWNRSLEDEELLSQNKLFHERFNMKSNTITGEPINQEIDLTQGGYAANTLSLEYTIET